MHPDEEQCGTTDIGEIEVLLRDQGELLDVLDLAANSLDKKTGPVRVSRPVDKTDCGVSVPEALMSPIAQQIHERNARISTISSRLSQITGELGL